MKKFFKKRLNKKGFTLVEVLVGLALLGVFIPLCAELFYMGYNIMGEAAGMVNESNRVAQSLESGNTLAGVQSTKYNQVGAMNITSEIEGFNIIGSQTTVTYTTRKMIGDTIEYTAFE